jgi:hypothetical protein
MSVQSEGSLYISDSNMCKGICMYVLCDLLHVYTWVRVDVALG